MGFEDWMGDLMLKDGKKKFTIKRMCPPGIIKFCFSVRGKRVDHDENIPIIKLPT